MLGGAGGWAVVSECEHKTESGALEPVSSRDGAREGWPPPPPKSSYIFGNFGP